MYKGSIPYNTAMVDYVSLVDATTGFVLANPTLAAGDVKLFLDNVDMGNLDTIPDVNPAVGKQVRIRLAAVETVGSKVKIVFHDQTGQAEWDDLEVDYTVDPAMNLYVQGSVNDTAPYTNQFVTTLTTKDTNFYKDANFAFLTGANVGVPAKKVSNYINGGRFVFDIPFPGVVANGDKFILTCD